MEHDRPPRKKAQQPVAIANISASWLPSTVEVNPEALKENIIRCIPIVDKLVGCKMFVLSTWYVLRLPYRPTNAMDAPESPLEWGLKTLSRQNFFTDVGVGLDPTNNVLSLMAFLITWRVVGRAVAEDASCCSQEANLQGFDSFITEHIGNNSLRPAMEALCLYMRYHCERSACAVCV